MKLSGKEVVRMMFVANWLRRTALWFVLPAVAIAAVVGTVIAGYEPLVFDPSLYETQTAVAAELELVDAEAIETANKADEPPVDVELASVSSAAGALLADGAWTGYAACGALNPDGWKPYYVGVTVKVSGGKVADISRIFGSSTGDVGDEALDWDAAENQKYLDWAISGRDGSTGVKMQVVGRTALAGIDAVSGATYSSAAIYNAYAAALGKAAAAAGTAVFATRADEPEAKGKKPQKVKRRVRLAALADGTWTGFAQCGPDPAQSWKPYYVGVTLTVKGGKVTSLRRVFGSSRGDKGSTRLTWDRRENGVYMDGAVSGVVAQIKAALATDKALDGIDTVAGATFSSKSIYEAYYAALEKSAAAAGSTVERPSGDSGGHDEGKGDSDSRQDDAGADVGETFYGFALCDSTGVDSWGSYYVFVSVSAAEGEVQRVVRAYGDGEGIVDADLVYSASENATYLNWAIDGKFGGAGYRMKSIVKQIQEKIDAQLPVSGISTVSGATRSSRAILEAYEMAAENAAAGVGRSPEEAVRRAIESEDGGDGEPDLVFGAF